MKSPLTTLCYLEKDGMYLMMHRTKKEQDISQGKWLGVGGHFEKNESPEDCMKREVWEETGYTPLAWQLRGLVTFITDTTEAEYMHLFTVTAWEGELHECNEGDLVWVKKEEVPQLNLWEGDRLFLKLLAEDVPFFSMKLSYIGDRLVEATLNGEAYPI